MFKFLIYAALATWFLVAVSCKEAERDSESQSCGDDDDGGNEPSPEGCGGDPNAVKTKCGTYCGHSCSDYNISDRILCAAVCNPDGCACKKNYVYDPNVKKCVLPKDCTPKCSKNEVYSDCTNGQCGPRSCDQLDSPIGCPKLDRKYCKKGCICAEGYYRDENEKCIPKDKCPSSGGCGGDPNAVKTDCGSYCRHSCSDYNRTGVLCPDVCNPDGCACKKNYVYDPQEKKCVLPKDCTPQCPKNEVYSTCTQGQCGPKTCKQLGTSVPCPRIDPKYCKKGCLCAEGYLRDDNGKCIPKDKCPSSGGCDGDPNAVRSDCGGYCGHSCYDYNKKNVACPLICKIDACSCKKGYVYDPNVKKCVSPEDCTLQCTGPHEVYNSCAPTCPPQTCATIGAQFKCVKPPKPGDPECKEGCRCESGYYRDNQNICVEKSECSKCTKPNEVYDSCPPTCPPDTCASIGRQYKCPEQPSPGDPKCNPKCRCKKGFYRNSKDECVPKSECDSYKGCGGDPNAVKSDCGTYCGHSCSDYNKTDVICPDVCNPDGCACKKNYVYDPNVKKCVLPKDCTSGCGGDPNAVSGCSNYCGHSCTDYNKSVVCPQFCKADGCACKEGYVYDQNIKKCVLPQQCKTCPENEVYNTCPTVKCDADYCPKSRDTPQTCPVGIVCDPPRCTCAFNTRRDLKTGKCIPIRNCPPFECDRGNEEYQPCPSKCPSDQCSDYVKNTTCGAPLGTRIGIVVPCQPQCRCKEGFYRNSNGLCVEPDKCHKCKSSAESSYSKSEEDEDK